MEIRPTTPPPQLTQLTHVADSEKSMDRDARERHTHSARRNTPEEKSEEKTEEQTPFHFLDQLA